MSVKKIRIKSQQLMVKMNYRPRKWHFLLTTFVILMLIIRQIDIEPTIINYVIVIASFIAIMELVEFLYGYIFPAFALRDCLARLNHFPMEVTVIETGEQITINNAEELPIVPCHIVEPY